MPRNESGVYSLPAGSTVADGEDILASQHNTPLQDIALDMNAARPVTAGGTGASTPTGARSNLGLVLTPTNTSTTAGQVLKVGDYGLGGSILFDDCDDIVETGNYYAAGATFANGPSTVVNTAQVGLVVDQMQNSSNLLQTLNVLADGRIFKRNYVAGVWSAWRQPTVVSEAVAIGASGTVWTYPAAFISPPVITSTVVSASAAIVTIQTVTTTSVTVNVWNTAGTGIARTVHLQAKGA